MSRLRLTALTLLLLAIAACSNSIDYTIPNLVQVQHPAMTRQSGSDSIPMRAIRHFAVYKSGNLVLKGEAKPGILLSTAHPAPEGPPKHPFINAQAYRSASENEVGALLRQSSSYDGFLQLLLSYGYDLFSVDNGPVPTSISEGYRIAKGNDLVAVVWEHPGQFSNIQQQPEMGQLTSTFASMVVYDAANGSDLMELFNTAKDFEDLLSGIEEARLKLGKV